MPVGQELAKITDLKLFHNRMTIDLVSHFFGYVQQKEKDWLICCVRKYSKRYPKVICMD